MHALTTYQVALPSCKIIDLLKNYRDCAYLHAGEVGQPTNVNQLNATATTVTIGFQVSWITSSTHDWHGLVGEARTRHV